MARRWIAIVYVIYTPTLTVEQHGPRRSAGSKLLPAAMVSEVWRTLSRIFRIGRARFIVGYDLNKNVYYELPSLHGDPKRTRRLIQWNKAIAYPSDFNPKDIPIQWDAWMRHTRKYPPTIEELLRDRERQMIVQHNARVLEMRYEAERAQLESERESDHAEAIRAQTEREMHRIESIRAIESLTSAQGVDPPPSDKAGIQSTTVQPTRRRGG